MRSASAWAPGAAGVPDHAAQLGLRGFGHFLRNDAPVDPQAERVGDHVGVDAAVDEADHHRRMRDAGCLRRPTGQYVAVAVERGQECRCGLDGIVAGVGPCRMGRLAAHRHLEVQAAVVGHHHVVREGRREHVVGPAQALRKNPARSGHAAGFLVVGEVEFGRAGQGHAGCVQLLQRAQREGIGREVGLRDRRTAAIEPAVPHFAAIRVDAPARARRHDVAMRVERHHGAVAEALAHDQVGDASHAVRRCEFGRHRMPFDLEIHALEQAGRELRMRRAVPGRIVGRALHQLRERAHLLVEMGVDELAQRVARGRVVGHGVEVKENGRCETG